MQRQVDGHHLREVMVYVSQMSHFTFLMNVREYGPDAGPNKTVAGRSLEASSFAIWCF